MNETIESTAQRLKADIRRRGLSPGARYLTAEETARMFGLTVDRAHRALRVLADQEFVVRRRNSGTYVGPAMANDLVVEIRSVCLLIPAEGNRADLGGLVQAVQAYLPDVNDVRIVSVPSNQSVEFVQSLLQPIRTSGQLAGVISISCPREVYSYLGENGFPFLVLGSLYSGQEYPSVDTDQHRAGYLLTHHLISHGHTRLALLSWQNHPGANYFHDGATEALSEAQLAANSLILRNPTIDPETARAQIDELLCMANAPTAFIAQRPVWAEEIVRVADSHGLRVPKDIEIVVQHGSVIALSASTESLAFPYVRPVIAYDRIAQLVGGMLATLSQGELDQQQKNVVVPVELCLPKQTEAI